MLHKIQRDKTNKLIIFELDVGFFAAGTANLYYIYKFELEMSSALRQIRRLTCLNIHESCVCNVVCVVEAAAINKKETKR